MMRTRLANRPHNGCRRSGAAKRLPFAFLRAVCVVAAGIVCGAGFGDAALAQARAVPDGQDQVRLTFAPIVKQAAPAVANIFAKRVVRSNVRSPMFNDPFLRRFLGDDFFGRRLPRERMQNTLGSGVVVRSDGVIVTNNHVIENTTEIRVVLSDRREFDAEVILADPQTDLAVLKIDPGTDELPVLEFADSDGVEVGDLVLAIGNPFGVGQTVTSGIVSATSRTQAGVSDYQFFIQTDAAINPGNSGGALVGVDGALIGVNTAIFSRSGGSIGIGFAIPANMVQRVVESALGGAQVVRPWLGASGQPVTRDIAQSLGLDRSIGILISNVYPGGPAEEGGLRIGDVILKVDGWEIFDPQSLRYRVATGIPGRLAKMEIWREGGIVSVQVPLKPAPEDPPRELTRLSGEHPLTGLTIANLSPAYAEELGLNPGVIGVIIANLPPRSPAYRLGLRQGDIVLGIGGEKVERVGDAVRLTAAPRDIWNLRIRRGGRVISMRVSS